jgi:hypothetical protein
MDKCYSGNYLPLSYEKFKRVSYLRNEIPAELLNQPDILWAAQTALIREVCILNTSHLICIEFGFLISPNCIRPIIYADLLMN